MKWEDLEFEGIPRGITRLWPRRAEMFFDMQCPSVLWDATREVLGVPGRARDSANYRITEGVAELLYDANAPAGIRSPADVTEDELAREGMSRDDLEFLVACERINAVENGARVEDVLPVLTFVPAPVCRVRSFARRAPRARTARRRVRRSARAPDRPRLGDSRPRPLPPPRRSRRAGWVG